MADDDSKGPAVRFPPLLIFLTVVLGSIAVDAFVPFSLGGAPALKYAGTALVLAGFMVIGVAAASFHRAGTHLEPWKPTARIVSHGIFRYSRNPIYVAFCLLQVGTGLWLDNGWTVVTFPVSAALLFRVAIKREEAYLEHKFGKEYLDYKQAVRRWL